MKTTIIKVQLSSLLKCMTLVGKIIQSGVKNNPDLSEGRFRLRTQGNTLLLTATDTAGAIDGTVECIEIDGEMDFCIDSTIIKEALKQIPEQPLTITVTEHDKPKKKGDNVAHGNMRVEYFPGEFEIPTYDASLYPTINMGDNIKSVSLDADVVRTGMELATRCLAVNNERAVLSSAFMEVLDGTLTFVGTDANMMAYRETSPIECDGNITAIIPGKAAKLITSMLQLCGDKIDVVVSTNVVMIKSAGYKFMYRLMEGKYVNYRSIIPDSTIRVEVDRMQLLGALRRSIVFATELSEIKLELDKNSLYIDCENKDYQQGVHEEVTVSYSGDPFKIGLSAGKMITLISGLDCAQVELQFTEPNRPALIIPAPESDGITMLLMPIFFEH